MWQWKNNVRLLNKRREYLLLNTLFLMVLKICINILTIFDKSYKFNLKIGFANVITNHFIIMKEALYETRHKHTDFNRRI